MRIKIGKLGVLVCVLSVNLCAALPPQGGLEVRGGAGAGKYTYNTGGCGSPTYRNEATDLKAHARLQTHSKRDHWSVTLEGSVSHSEVTATKKVRDGESMPAPEDIQAGRARWGYASALRVGLHFHYGGVEFGPAVYSNGIIDLSSRDNKPTVAISGMGWLGDPKLAYAWASIFEGPSSASLFPVSVGVGHMSDGFRLTMGFVPLANMLDIPLWSGQLVGQVEFLLPFEQPIWLGVMGNGRSEQDLGGMVTLAVPFGAMFK